MPPSLPPLPYGLPEPPATKRGFGSGAGRRVGQKDKITIALKEAILLASEEVGHEIDPEAEDGLVGYLKHVARTDTRAMCGLLSKVLPMQVTGEGGGSLVVEIVKRTYANDTTPA